MYISYLVLRTVSVKVKTTGAQFLYKYSDSPNLFSSSGQEPRQYAFFLLVAVYGV